jgi:hypothetical protein
MEKQYEIVIASHGESLKWLRHIPQKDDRKYKLTVSNSNGGIGVPTADRTVVIENAGREAGHYLKFIIDNYDNLLPVTVFLQADPWAHASCYSDSLLDILFGDPTFSHPMCYLGADYSTQGCPIQRYTPLDFVLRLGWGNEQYPTGSQFSIGAQFYATKETILKRPVEHYKNIYSAAFDPNIPSLGHLLEGAWGNVFQH